LPPVAVAFKDFLTRDGAPLLESITGILAKPAPRATRGRSAKAAR
jgi:hypothetical protein